MKITLAFYTNYQLKPFQIDIKGDIFQFNNNFIVINANEKLNKFLNSPKPLIKVNHNTWINLNNVIKISIIKKENLFQYYKQLK
jgi:hypothetical protein